jgi:hypothetical protein
MGFRQKIDFLPLHKRVVLNFLFFKTFVFFSRQFYSANSRTSPIPFDMKTAQAAACGANPLRGKNQPTRR